MIPLGVKIQTALIIYCDRCPVARDEDRLLSSYTFYQQIQIGRD